MKTELIVLFAFILIGLGLFLIHNNLHKTPKPTMGDVYLGPVPQGYDENHYRKTGITKPLE